MTSIDLPCQSSYPTLYIRLARGVCKFVRLILVVILRFFFFFFLHYRYVKIEISYLDRILYTELEIEILKSYKSEYIRDATFLFYWKSKSLKIDILKRF